MAKIPEIEERLLRWAEWVRVGDGSGYPRTSPLHRAWTPPSPGQTPTMKTSAFGDVKATHRIVIAMPSDRLKQIVECIYLRRLTSAATAAWVGCSIDTVYTRVCATHVYIRDVLAQ